MAKKKSDKNEKKADSGSSIARNKRAFHDYEVLERLECGMALQGTEVKSLRNGSVTFADSYVTVRDGKLLLVGLNIAEYKQGNINNHEPTRTRTLLAHKREIRKLSRAVGEKGLTVVPLNLHWSRGIAKCEVGLCRGKARYDKRETIKNRDLNRQKQRIMRNHGR